MKDPIGKVAQKVKIAAGLFWADYAVLGEQVRELEAGGVDWFHVEVRDGKYMDFGAHTLLRNRIRPDKKRVAVELVAEAAAEGDEPAHRIIATAGRYCGIALSMIVQVLNPQRIVVGGGLTHIGPALMEPAMETMRHHTQPQLWDSVQVVLWQLKDDVGIIGAAAKALIS